MARFGTGRDALFIKHISKEMINKVISVEIALYKLSLNDTEITIYNESSKKIYFNPIRLFALVRKEDFTMNDEDTGLNTAQNVVFSFLRDDLKDNNVLPVEGDLIKFDGKFYEIDNINQIQYWFGRNPDTLLLTTEGRSNIEFGYNIAIKCSCHFTRQSQLNLVDIRSGITKPKNLPRNL